VKRGQGTKLDTTSGAKAQVFLSLNVVAEQASEKVSFGEVLVAQPLLAVRFSRWIASRMRESPENRTAKSGCATFFAAFEAATHKGCLRNNLY
jgi:hypothetical protein